MRQSVASLFRPKTFHALGFALALALTFGVGSASADLMFSLTTNNGGFGNPPGPYGTVTVHLVSSTEATITAIGGQVGSNVYLFGDGGTLGFNTNGAVTVQSITGSNSRTDSGFGAFTPGPFTAAGAGNEDGFGSFNQTINDFDGYQHSVNSITVDITLNSGSWASAASVLTPNASGFSVADHLFLAMDNGNGTISNTGSTGFVVDGPSTVVPEPSALILLGTVVMLIAGHGWRRRRKARLASWA
jgi:hypothetical protein